MNILIAVDESEASRVAVRVAEALFPHGEFIVMSAAAIAPLVLTDPIGGGMFAAGTSAAALEASEHAADAAVQPVVREQADESVTEHENEENV
jgi:hypothetical protein